MDILTVFRSFSTQEQCLEYLEDVRWRGEPACVYCGSVKVCRHASGDRASQRWQCQDCRSTFAVTVGTIFHRTHVPLQQWFLVLALMLNAKKSASACQIARDLGMRRPTVWSMMHRVREAMATDQEQGRLLYGIVEADETFVGGKPRYRGKLYRPLYKDGTGPLRPYKGKRPDFKNRKTPVLGAVERGGRVAAEPADDVSGTSIQAFLGRVIDRAGTLLVTDEWSGYGRYSPRAVINHSRTYVDGMIHTNTIEGFWSLVKRAWYGQHHHYSKKYMPLYISEACYKYNHRRTPNGFAQLVGAMVGAA